MSDRPFEKVAEQLTLKIWDRRYPLSNMVERAIELAVEATGQAFVAELEKYPYAYEYHPSPIVPKRVIAARMAENLEKRHER